MKNSKNAAKRSKHVGSTEDASSAVVREEQSPLAAAMSGNGRNYFSSHHLQDPRERNRETLELRKKFGED